MSQPQKSDAWKLDRWVWFLFGVTVGAGLIPSAQPTNGMRLMLYVWGVVSLALAVGGLITGRFGTIQTRKEHARTFWLGVFIFAYMGISEILTAYYVAEY